jgi:hypothetical protein
VLLRRVARAEPLVIVHEVESQVHELLEERHIVFTCARRAVDRGATLTRACLPHQALILRVDSRLRGPSESWVPRADRKLGASWAAADGTMLESYSNLAAYFPKGRTRLTVRVGAINLAAIIGVYRALG